MTDAQPDPVPALEGEAAANANPPPAEAAEPAAQ